VSVTERRRAVKRGGGQQAAGVLKQGKVGKGLRGRTPALTCAAKAEGKRSVVAEAAVAPVALVTRYIYV